MTDEVYPAGWAHAIVHLNPDTGEFHVDPTQDARGDSDEVLRIRRFLQAWSRSKGGDTAEPETPKPQQHERIPGYRTLSEDEIRLVGRIKGVGSVVGALVEELEQLPDADQAPEYHAGVLCDRRWLAIGRTELQQGFMAITRSVTRPGGF